MTSLAYSPAIDSVANDFAHFYRTEYPRLAGSLRLVCGSEELAEEFAQEAFTRALNHWDRLSTYDRPAGWVYTTGFNVLRAYWSRKKRDEGPLRTEPIAPMQPSDAERVDLVRVLARLPLAQRQAVVMRHILDMSSDDAADATGLQPSAFRMTLSRALKTLRDDAGLQLDDDAPLDDEGGESA